MINYYEIGQDKSERLLRMGGNQNKTAKLTITVTESNTCRRAQDYIKTEQVTSKNYNQAIILTGPVR